MLITKKEKNFEKEKRKRKYRIKVEEQFMTLF